MPFRLPRQCLENRPQTDRLRLITHNCQPEGKPIRLVLFFCILRPDVEVIHPMRKFLPFFLLIFLGLGTSYAQNEEEGCRLKREDLRPIIVRFNPFFANHKWDSTAQLEMAQMSDTHLIAITQDGCKRHHVRVDLIVSPEASQNNYDFWVEEVKSMMEKVYWERPEYQEFQADFERIFDEKLHYYGFNSSFNFPIATRNFICAVYYDPSRGARVSIEVVSFIFRENVESPSNQRRGMDEDDGWKGLREDGQ